MVFGCYSGDEESYQDGVFKDGISVQNEYNYFMIKPALASVGKLRDNIKHLPVEMGSNV